MLLLNLTFASKKSQLNLVLRVASKRALRMRLLSANWSEVGFPAKVDDDGMVPTTKCLTNKNLSREV